LPLITGCHTDSNVSTFTYTIELPVLKTTLEEAGITLWVTIPTPDYLPEGYDIQEVYLHGHTVMLLVSKGEIEKELVTRSSATGSYQVYECQCPMTIEISYDSQGIPGGLKFTGGGESINVIPGQGEIMSSLIADKESHNELWWEWRPDESYGAPIFRIGIAASKQFSREELVKIAESFEY
jgi:hypothetical protein